ncbi:hypothetical protein LCGC14_2786870 [marine sediment metagenome]|uniref:Uncharacterized protein n=1 Tax=marine sediment metagenome TaxID=412755 RepID=A0A0F8ZDR1_9ZZZZ
MRNQDEIRRLARVTIEQITEVMNGFCSTLDEIIQDQPEPIHDIRWAAEQLANGKPVHGQGEPLRSRGPDYVIQGYDGPFRFTPEELLATNYKLVKSEPAEIERKCGDCEHWSCTTVAAKYWDTCSAKSAVRIHRESIACKDFEGAK